MPLLFTMPVPRRVVVQPRPFYKLGSARLALPVNSCCSLAETGFFAWVLCPIYSHVLPSCS